MLQSNTEVHVGNLDNVFLNMSTLIAHQLIRDTIKSSIPVNTSNIYDIVLRKEINNNNIHI